MASDAPSRALNRLGQSLWLGNITRDLLDDATLLAFADHGATGGVLSRAGGDDRRQE